MGGRLYGRYATYERSKRGLANGGRTLLGYRRDRQHKGHLLVEETEAEMLRRIFETYGREKSIHRTAELIKERHEGCTDPPLTPNLVP